VSFVSSVGVFFFFVCFFSGGRGRFLEEEEKKKKKKERENRTRKKALVLAFSLSPMRPRHFALFLSLSLCAQFMVGKTPKTDSTS